MNTGAVAYTTAKKVDGDSTFVRATAPLFRQWTVAAIVFLLCVIGLSFIGIVEGPSAGLGRSAVVRRGDGATSAPYLSGRQPNFVGNSSGTGTINLLNGPSGTAYHNVHTQLPNFFAEYSKAWTMVLVGFCMLFWVASSRPWSIRRRVRGALIAVLCMLAALTAYAARHGFAKTGFDYRRFHFHGLTMQPSELAKPLIILFVAELCVSGVFPLSRFRDGFLRCIAVPLTAAILVAAARDFGTATLIVGCALTALFLCGAQSKHLFAVVTVGALVMSAGYFKTGIVRDRVDAVLQPALYARTLSYQIVHSERAYANGGITGVSVGSGEEKHYLPEADSDFVMSTVGEEWGLLGVMATLLLELGCVLCGWFIAKATSDKFSRIVVIAIPVSWMMQTLVNIGGTAGFIPLTGVPVPFISAGGTALIVQLACAGIVIGIARHVYVPRNVGSVSCLGQKTNVEANTTPGKAANENGSDRRGNGRASISGVSGRGVTAQIRPSR